MSWIQTAYLIAEIIRHSADRLADPRLDPALAVCRGDRTFHGGLGWLCRERRLRGVDRLSRGAGFCRRMLIPSVFSAVFLLFPVRLHAIATTLAGIVAVLAPTVGPVVGGWITQTYSWHWLFLINIVPGLIAAGAAPWLLPRQRVRFGDMATLDVASLVMIATALASLEIGLKQAPRHGWLSPTCVVLLVVSIGAAALFVRRTLRAERPIVDLSVLGDRSFAIGCALSFCLGVGLFGSVYLMPVVLAFVRGHDAFDIGTIMLVTGVAQLLTAPVAGTLDSRFDPRPLTALGFGLFALGLGLSAFETRTADFDEMFWPQVVRGIAIMFCLLPPTRLALEGLPEVLVPDGSSLFNLMRISAVPSASR